VVTIANATAATAKIVENFISFFSFRVSVKLVAYMIPNIGAEIKGSSCDF